MLRSARRGSDAGGETGYTRGPQPNAGLRQERQPPQAQAALRVGSPRRQRQLPICMKAAAGRPDTLTLRAGLASAAAPKSGRS